MTVFSHADMPTRTHAAAFVTQQFLDYLSRNAFRFQDFGLKKLA
jgi:hypothetical protein